MLSAAWDADLPPMEKLVLLALADCSNDEGHCWPSAATLRRKSGQGERTVRRCIQALILKKHITQHQRSGTSPVYDVHPCHSGTPATAAPLPDRPVTPAGAAPKPKRTVSSSEAKASSPRAWALPVGVSLQVWGDFKRNRQRKRLPNTDTAWKAFNDDLTRVSAQTGIPPPKLIEMCTAKGWGGIYDPRGQDDGRRSNTLGRHQSPDGLSPTTRAALDVFGP
jgi:hypothetical protein